MTPVHCSLHFPTHFLLLVQLLSRLDSTAAVNQCMDALVHGDLQLPPDGNYSLSDTLLPLYIPGEATSERRLWLADVFVALLQRAQVRSFVQSLVVRGRLAAGWCSVHSMQCSMVQRCCCTFLAGPAASAFLTCGHVGCLPPARTDVDSLQYCYARLPIYVPACIVLVRIAVFWCC